VINRTADDPARRSSGPLSTIIAALLLSAFVSACAGTNTASSAQPQSTAGAAAVAQAPATAPAAPAANPGAGASDRRGRVIASTDSNSPPEPEHLVGVGSETVITVHGKVVAVDRKKKLVTLEGPNGKQITIHVYNPYNLAAAKPGARFVAKFYEMVTVHRKRPGAAEPSASVAQGVFTATPGQTPGTVAATRIRLTVVVDSIDRDTGTVSIKGPDGKVDTVSVANPANLKHIKVGDEIVITWTNAVAIALEKESVS